ncbi:MAG: lipid II:glycine glycyltransferase FemX [Actinomycetota bacterium]|nr:peptidoglycan bridge formation glycyltransferase FemA/FemB family protein [Actinomycetota bacterium]
MSALTPRVMHDADRTSYDAYVSASPLADVMQSWAWGEVKAGSGWTPRRLVLEEAGRIIAAGQVLETRPVRGAPPILYCPRGPVLDYARPEVLRAFVDAVRARAGAAVLLKCDPPVELGSPEAASLTAAGMRKAGGGGFGGVQPTAVMVLDLGPGLEKVQEGFHKKWRYNIRLAERKGVEISEAGRDELDVFYELLLETAKRDHFLVRGREYFAQLFDVLKPAGQLAMFLTRYEGKPIAGALLLSFGNRATYTYGASSNKYRNVMPNHLMQWKMIEWAHAHGYRIYDFRGVSPVRDGEPVEAHIAGLNRFKEGFGARYVEYVGEWDVPIRRLLYQGWRYGAPLAMKALKAVRGQSGSIAD